MRLKPNVIRPRDIEAATGLPRSSAYRLAAEGKFPKPIKLSTRASGWLRADVEQWLAERAASRVKD